MDSDLKTMKLQVEGIVCTGCAEDMEIVLKDMDGIDDVSVDYSSGIITIEYDPDEVGDNELYIKVQKFGFKTTVLQ